MTQTTTTSTGTIARPNDGRYKLSGEAKRREVLCGDLKLIADTAFHEAVHWDEAANNAARLGEKELAERFDCIRQEEEKTMDAATADAKKVGCSWATQ